ncbi:MAG: 7-carboxy-7-deazaguanine synthase QueE [Spirochaetota bacterium]
MALLISEIFVSLQGETTACGFPSLFIRMAGCNLLCSYCDTAYARSSGGTPMSIDEIAEIAVKNAWVHHVTLTGGEPLSQAETPLLAEKLIKNGFRVRVETNGSFPIASLPRECEKIVDIKSPASGEAGSFCEENIPLRTDRDEVKFVVADDDDFLHAAGYCENQLRNSPAVINISPVFGAMPYDRLAQLIISRRLNARFNLQFHKILWPQGEPK